MIQDLKFSIAAIKVLAQGGEGGNGHLSACELVLQLLNSVIIEEKSREVHCEPKNREKDIKNKKNKKLKSKYYGQEYLSHTFKWDKVKERLRFFH